MEEKKYNRNGTLEFLRFVFCICILLFHIEKEFFGLSSLDNGVGFGLFTHGAMGVEFFFILSGLFMAKSIDSKRNKDETIDIGEDSWKFLINKYKGFFLYHIIAFVILFIVTIIINEYSFSKIVITFIDSIPSIFLLQMTGIPCTSLNHIEWYLSAMIISMAIIYPICKKYFNLFIKYIAPICSILILGYLGYTYGYLTGVNVWTGFAFKGLVRGFAEIMLGTFAYYLSKKLSNYKNNLNKYRLFITIIECLLYISVILFMVLTVNEKYEFTALIAIFFGIVISYSDISHSNKLFNNKLCYFLGKFSLPVYLSQLSAISIAVVVFSQYSNGIKISIAIILTFIFSLATMFLGDFMRKKRNNSFKNK